MLRDPVSFLESSFLSPYLESKDITDISFNGQFLFYERNSRGRLKASTSPTSSEVGAFLRQIANLTEKQFSYLHPILDVSFGPYRLNAVNDSLARQRNGKVFTFSLRIATENCSLEKDSFFQGNSREILLSLIKSGESIIVGGKTSTGKTELEKWLLMAMPMATRVIVIDNVEELDRIKNEAIDLSTWLVNDEIKSANFSSLVKNSLRNNPDYIVLAEARGKEMFDALVAAMSGHPIITAIHAQNIFMMPNRIVSLVMMASNSLSREEVLYNVGQHLHYYVFLEKRKKSDGSLSRYVQSIGVFQPETHSMKLLFERKLK